MNKHVERAKTGDRFCVLVWLKFWEMEARWLAGAPTSYPNPLAPLATEPVESRGAGYGFCTRSLGSA